MVDTPPPESCANNLHRAAERQGAPPEATDLCVNEAGAFHMVDCPLTWGRSCVFYDRASSPHPVASEAELGRVRRLLADDFLRWPYARRVRALEAGLETLPEPIPVEPVEEAEEQVPESLAAVEVESVPPEAAPEPAEESYPGQRRSEDRRKRPPPDQLPPDSPPGESATAADAEPEEERPRTVEALFDVLPEAPDVPVKSDPDRPRRRRRRRKRGRRSGRGRSDGPSET